MNEITLKIIEDEIKQEIEKIKILKKSNDILNNLQLGEANGYFFGMMFVLRFIDPEMTIKYMDERKEIMK